MEMLIEEIGTLPVHPRHLLCADGGSGFGGDAESGAETDSQESSQDDSQGSSQGSQDDNEQLAMCGEE